MTSAGDRPLDDLIHLTLPNELSQRCLIVGTKSKTKSSTAQHGCHLIAELVYPTYCVLRAWHWSICPPPVCPPNPSLLCAMYCELAGSSKLTRTSTSPLGGFIV